MASNTGPSHGSQQPQQANPAGQKVQLVFDPVRDTTRIVPYNNSGLSSAYTNTGSSANAGVPIPNTGVPANTGVPTRGANDASLVPRSTAAGDLPQSSSQQQQPPRQQLQQEQQQELKQRQQQRQKEKQQQWKDLERQQKELYAQAQPQGHPVDPNVLSQDYLQRQRDALKQKLLQQQQRGHRQQWPPLQQRFLQNELLSQQQHIQQQYSQGQSIQASQQSQSLSTSQGPPRQVHGDEEDLPLLIVPQNSRNPGKQQNFPAVPKSDDNNASDIKLVTLNTQEYGQIVYRTVGSEWRYNCLNTEMQEEFKIFIENTDPLETIEERYAYLWEFTAPNFVVHHEETGYWFGEGKYVQTVIMERSLTPTEEELLARGKMPDSVMSVPFPYTNGYYVDPASLPPVIDDIGGGSDRRKTHFEGVSKTYVVDKDNVATVYKGTDFRDSKGDEPDKDKTSMTSF